jgi:hypothetical protein
VIRRNSAMFQNIKEEWIDTSEARVSMFRAGNMNQHWPLIFGTSRVISITSFLIVRSVLAAGFASVIIADMVRSFDNGYYFIYLTDWSIIVETLYLWLAVFTTFQARRLGTLSTSTDKMPCYVRAMYWLWSLAMPIVICVSLAYWTLLNPLWALEPVNFITIFVHFLNMVFLCVELYLSRNAFHLKLATFSFLAYCWLYVGWTVIHFFAKVGTFAPCGTYPRDECPIYTPIDWHAPGQTLAIIIGMNFLGFLTIFAVWVLTRCRDSSDKDMIRINATGASSPCISGEVA